jgi:acyl-CoA synthetase (AMP-forming)/AMP-acid ligase II
MSFSSPYRDVDIPETSVYDYLFGGIDDAAMDRVALVDVTTGVQTSYRELLTRIDAFAGGLAERGIGAGDVVGLLSPNSSVFAVAFHGILRAGATATTINALATANEIAKQLSDSHARMLITVAPLLERAEKAAAVVDLSDADVVVLDGAGREAHGATGSSHAYAADMLAAGRPAPQVSFDPSTHLAVLPYSSGTTAKPKGVMLTHRNLVANVAQIQPMLPMTADDKVLAVLPFFHIYGMTVLNEALRARSRLIVMPAFDLDDFLANIQNHRCTIVFIAPPVAVALAKHPLVDSYDLSSLQTVVSAAAPLDANLGHAVAARIGCRVVQGYGMSELSPVGHCIPAHGGEQPFGKIAPLSSCGWTVPNAQSMIVDPETGEEIRVPDEGRSATGELWFKGPNVMAGYLGNARATAETIDAEGFLHTGDLACVDSDGCVYIVDRLKELIKYKGYQVPPAELEALLLTHPAIADAAVVGVPDDSGQEIPKAFVVKQSGTALTEAEVMGFVAGEVAPYKKVRQVEFIDAIPKSPSGKILRKDLRARVDRRPWVEPARPA